MKSAYLYVRVSTDEQKKKGFSLIEQEDRLVKHCETNQILIKGIFREDFSAKTFDRPEWKKLVKTIKKKRHLSPENILFIRWDRFSRSIEYAYQMIGVLRNLKTQAMAIDQPIDFNVPESIVMLAIYLSIPEAENNRRGLNTSSGLRRARKMGRWPSKAPIGYKNASLTDGKKMIIPKQPEAGHMIWSFKEYSKGKSTINHVRKMANLKGLKCSRNNFWKALRNPFYCGLISVPATKNEEAEMVTGIHEPLISQQLFQEVQQIMLRRNSRNPFKNKIKPVFVLRGFLKCPYCDRRLTASISSGKRAKYRYYHCMTSKCKGRIRADHLDTEYETFLKGVILKPEIKDLFELVLEDENIVTVERGYTIDRIKIMEEISKQEILLSKARRHFLEDRIDFDDFNDLKKEYKELLKILNDKLAIIDEALIGYQAVKCTEEIDPGENNILKLYQHQDISGKTHIIDLFTPGSINPVTKKLNSLHINQALSMITLVANKKLKLDFPKATPRQTTSQSRYGMLSDRKISTSQTIKILKNNGINVDVDQAKTIIDFLYLFAKAYQKEPRREIEHEMLI